MSVRNTRTPAGGAATGRRGRLGAGVLLLLGLLVGLIGLAPVAGAHHANIEANGECGRKVSWKVFSWSNKDDEGDNTRVAVEYRLPTDAAGSWRLVQDNIEFDVPTDPAYDPQTGSFTAVGTTSTVTVRVRVVDAWGNHNNGGQTESANVTFPTDCAWPTAAAELVCAQSKININFTGVGGATTVDIRKNNVQVANDWPVPVGASTYVMNLVAGDENTTVDIDLDYAAPGATDQANIMVPVNCKTPPKPSATVEWECGDANAVVTFVNDGDEPATADIYKGATQLYDDVAPGSYNVPIVAGDENTVVTIVVDFSGSTADFSKLIEVNCLTPPAPAASVDWECGDASAVVTLTNSGGEVASGSILKNGNPVAGLSNVVIPGVYDVPIVAGDENSTVTIEVDFSGSTADFSTQVEVDCMKPVAAVQFSCAEGGVLIQLTNSGLLDAFVDVFGEEVKVPKGTTLEDAITRLIAVAEGDDYDVTILGENAEGTRNCEEPAVRSFSVECAEGGVLVWLTNDGESPTDVFVDGVLYTVPGRAGESAENPAVPALVEVDEDAEFSFTVTGDDLDQTVEGFANCEADPSYTLDLAGACDENAPWIEYSVDDGLGAPVGLQAAAVVDSVDIRWYTIGTPNVLELEQLDMPGSARILWPGAVIDPETGEATDWPGWIQEADGSWVQGDDGFLWATGTVLVEVSSNGEVVSSEEVTYPPAKPDCSSGPPEEVEGEVVTSGAAAALPATGSDTTGLLSLAGALLLAGGLAHLVGHRRREHDLS